MHPFFFFFFLHTGSSTSWLLFDYRAAAVGIPVTQLNSLIFNHQVPPVCTSQDQDPAHSYGSFFSHSPIGSLLFLSQNTLFKAAYDVLSWLFGYLAWIICMHACK